MVRPLAFLVSLLLAGALLAGCEDWNGLVGISPIDGGNNVLIYAPLCSDEVGVRAVSLWQSDADQYVWEIETADRGKSARQAEFVPGITPRGFREVIPAVLPLPRHALLQVAVDFTGPTHAAGIWFFRISEIGEGQVYARGRVMSQEEFNELNPC